MKNLSKISILFLLLFFLSCNKENSSTQPENNSYAGHYEITSYSENANTGYGTGYIEIHSDGQLTGYVPLRYDNGVFRCDISGNIGLTGIIKQGELYRADSLIGILSGQFQAKPGYNAGSGNWKMSSTNSGTWWATSSYLKTKNLLKLHEAIVIALINLDKKNFTATFKDIASYITKRKLYEIRKGNIHLETQVMLRSTKAQKAYGYLFEFVNEDSIKLRIIN